MKTLFKSVLFVALALALLSLLAGAAIWHGLADEPGMHIIVNGDDFSPAHAGVAHWLGAGIGLLVAGAIGLAVACIVLPLALLLGIGLPVLIVGAVVGGVVFALLGVGAVLGSPLLLLGLIVFFTLRHRHAARRRASAARTPAANTQPLSIAP